MKTARAVLWIGLILGVFAGVLVKTQVISLGQKDQSYLRLSKDGQTAMTRKSQNTRWKNEYRKALEHADVGEYQAAERVYRSILAKDPKEAPAHHMLGTVLGAQGMYEEALESFLRALEIDPESSDTVAAVGNTYARLGNDEAAVAWCAAAVEMAPNSALNQLSLGTSLLNVGKLEQARPHFELAIELAPNTELAKRSEAALREIDAGGGLE